MNLNIVHELRKQIGTEDLPYHIKNKDRSIYNECINYIMKRMSDIKQDFIKVIFELIDLDKMIDLTCKYYYDPNVLSTLQMILITYFTTDQIDREDIGIRFNKLLTRFDVIETFDYTLLQSNLSLYVKSSSLYDLTLELFIALYCLNPLRYLTPCFSYVFTGLMTSPPIIDNDEVKNISCSRSNFYYNLVMEDVSGIKLYDMIDDCSFDDFLIIYLIILMSLEIANDRYSFTHYNLISDNVMVKKINTHVKFSRGVIKTRYIPHILDYSKSFVIYENKVFSTASFYDKGVNPTFPNYVSDSYQLLMSCLDICRFNNPALYSDMIEMRSWFTDTEPDFDNERVYSFRLPTLFSTRSNTKLIDWLISKYNIPLLSSESNYTNVSYCNFQQQCFTRDRLLDMVINNHRTLSLPEAYSLYQKLVFVADHERALSVLSNIDIYDFAVMYNELVKKQYKRLNSLSKGKTIKLDPRVIFGKTYPQIQTLIANVSYEIHEQKMLNYYFDILTFIDGRRVKSEKWRNDTSNVNENSSVIYQNQDIRVQSRDMLNVIVNNTLEIIDTLSDYVMRYPEDTTYLLLEDYGISHFWNIIQIYKTQIVNRCFRS